MQKLEVDVQQAPVSVEAGLISNREFERSLSGEDVDLGRGAVPLEPSDHHTMSSFVEPTVSHSYDVLKKELNVSAADKAGSAYITARISIGEVFKRLGIKIEVTDPKNTARTLKLLQSEQFRGSVASPKGQSSDSDSTVVVRSELKDVVARELERLGRYGPSRLVTAAHPVDKSETTQYGIKITFQGGKFACQVRSMETGSVTGSQTLAQQDVARRVAAMLSLSENDAVDFKEAVKTAKTYEPNESDNFVLRPCLGNRGELELSIKLPPDEFTDGSPVFSPVGVLAIAAD